MELSFYLHPPTATREKKKVSFASKGHIAVKKWLCISEILSLNKTAHFAWRDIWLWFFFSICRGELAQLKEWAQTCGLSCDSVTGPSAWLYGVMFSDDPMKVIDGAAIT